jgi:hypothetical protein
VDIRFNKSNNHCFEISIINKHVGLETYPTTIPENNCFATIAIFDLQKEDFIALRDKVNSIITELS